MKKESLNNLLKLISNYNLDGYIIPKRNLKILVLMGMWFQKMMSFFQNIQKKIG